MLTHDQVWGALDRLAAAKGLSVSALAKKAGLDATAFNRSKRTTPDGRSRWPSTESIAKVLSATGTRVEDFTALLESVGPAHLRGSAVDLPSGFAEDAPGRLPHLALERVTGADFDSAGLPSGRAWDEIAFPDLADARAYALEISGDGMLPLYREGDVIIVSPAASVRRGDRIVVKTRSGEVLVRELLRKTARTLHLRALNPRHPDLQYPLSDIQWVARIIWVRQ